MTAVLDVEAGRVVASRRELDALLAWSNGEGNPDDPAVTDLVEVGLIDQGVVHPAVYPVLGVLRTVTSRAALRRWCGGPRPIVEVLVGESGVLVLPGGHDLDVPQDLRWHPRPTAAARVLASLLDVPAHEGPPVLGSAPSLWTDLVAVANGPDGVVLADLRWSTRPGAPLVSVMVLAWAQDGGVVEVVPMEDQPGLVTCRPRHPLTVWTGLTRLLSPTSPR